MKLEDHPEIRRLEHVVNINWIKIAVIAVVSVLVIKYSDPFIGGIKELLGTMRPLFSAFDRLCAEYFYETAGAAVLSEKDGCVGAKDQAPGLCIFQRHSCAGHCDLYDSARRAVPD
ncbi:MAG: hypothetical protein ACLTSZ_19630 [Lachnospiraceae bacterium]